MRTNGVMLLLVLALPAHAGMDALDNEEMGDVTGQAGVAISLDWRLNVDKAGTQLGLCSGATYRECRIAWAFNNRGVDDGTLDVAGTPGTGKKWLVLKGFTGSLFIPYLRIDASQVTYTPDSGPAKTVPAALLSFGTGATGVATNTKIQIKNLTIDNMAMEQDSPTRRGYWADATTEPTGAAIPAGVNTGFMGLQINGPSNVANVQIDGTFKLFSCLGDHQSC